MPAKLTPLDGTLPKRQILDLLGWAAYTKCHASLLANEAVILATKQLRPRLILNWLVAFLKRKRIEVPTYYPIVKIITKALNQSEGGLIDIVHEKMTPEQRSVLDRQADTYDSKEAQKRISPVTLMKRLNQSPGAKKLNAGIRDFEEIKYLHEQLKDILDCLDLPTEIIRLYADYTIRSTKFQLWQLKPEKRYLYMIAFIAYQYNRMHDALIEHFIQAVQSANHSALSKFREDHFAERKDQGQVLYPFIYSLEKDVFAFIDDLEKTLETDELGSDRKVAHMKSMFADYKKKKPELAERMANIEHDLYKASKEAGFYDALESKSRALQRKISKIVWVMEIDPDSENKRLVLAINHFKYKKGKVMDTSPTGFLSVDERNIIYDDDHKFRVSLYKILLFRHIMTAIKSGTLNMLNSFKFRSLEEYMLPKDVWEEDLDDILNRASMTHLKDCDFALDKLKDMLGRQCKTTNEHIHDGKNEYVKFNKDGKAIVNTPKVDKDYETQVPDLFSGLHYIPIQEVLLSIHEQTQFIDAFEHFSNKYRRKKPDLKSFIATIIALGCNVGTGKIQKTAKGLDKIDLANIIKLYFSHHNILAANEKILKFASKLDVTNLQRASKESLHTSSDGQKIGVGPDSLIARRSFKYFGTGAGATDYGFIDERQFLWFSTMFSSAEREAAYVLDGLTYGDESFFDGQVIHSTDTHGYTEAIFGTSWMLGFSFAPRIKNLKKQRIYAFEPKKTYKDKGYKIIPHGKINVALIKKYWPEILRFVATIKLKESKASQLFGRLSSYSRENPFYKALKEFGKVIKSIFILKYIDDLKMRQSIEKQLNKAEQANKFSKAVFFDHSHEFMVGTKEEQDIASACKRLIQNAIICWNYMYMSQLIVDSRDSEERERLIENMRKKMAIAWRHINFLGEYEFTNEIKERVVKFDPLKITSLRIG